MTERVMIQYTNLDDVVKHCPCGSVRRFTSSWRDDEPCERWMREHKSHADVLEEHITDDGMRCLGGPKPAPVRRPL